MRAGNVQEASRLLGCKDVRVNCLDEVRRGSNNAQPVATYTLILLLICWVQAARRAWIPHLIRHAAWTRLEMLNAVR